MASAAIETAVIDDTLHAGPAAALERREILRALRLLNPGWRPTIFNGTRLVPKGYRLRLPADTAEKWSADLIMSKVP